MIHFLFLKQNLYFMVQYTVIKYRNLWVISRVFSFPPPMFEDKRKRIVKTRKKIEKYTKINKEHKKLVKDTS